MVLQFCDRIHEDSALRDSFNALTRRVFGFDFTAWDRDDLWTERYRPHALVCGGRVVANVSVNRMRFRAFDRELPLLQLGTVMTDPDFRGQGLARRLMEEVLSRAPEDVYLFANDGVLDFYPRFGFRRGDEYRCSRTVDPSPAAAARPIDSCAPENRALLDRLLDLPRPSEALALEDNPQLYLFYLLGPMRNCLYALPGDSGLAVAEREGDALTLHAVLAERALAPEWVAGCFEGVRRLHLAYTPTDRQGFDCDKYHEEDSTLFYRGRALEQLLSRRVLFPALSHA